MECKMKPTKLQILQFVLMMLVLGIGGSILSLYMTKYVKIQSISAMARSSRMFSCFDSPTTIADWVKPPSSLTHEMTDEELFWRASFKPATKEFPYKRVPKIAFMFLSKGPLPLAPLWERFFAGHEDRYSIYIHSLPSYSPNFTSSSVFYNRQIPSKVAEWGRMSMCDAERRLLANALLDLGNEWFVLVSESCIPLHNFIIVYHYISKSRYSFMGAFDEDGPYGRGRYNRRMEPEVRLDQWRKGSQWFEVHRDAAVRIVQDRKYYPKFRDYCTPACYVDEHYFPTMLTIEANHLLANRTVTWTDWSRGGAHPATFGSRDIKEEFFKKILESSTCLYNKQPSSLCFLFARKFAPKALDSLLSISSSVLGY